MFVNALGCVNSPETLRSWTKASKECYRNGCMCFKCSLPEDLKPRCKMKPVVLELVKKFGKP